MNARANGLVWLVLVLLTFVSFQIAPRFGSGHEAAWILPVAGGKGLLVGDRFMELHGAHPAWRFAFSALLVALTGLLFWLAGRSR